MEFAKFNIAVVDDEEAMQVVLKTALESELNDRNAKFLGAKSLEGFLEILERLQASRERLHLVLQDGHMPDVDGFDVIELVEWRLKRRFKEENFSGHLGHLRKFEARFRGIEPEVYEGVRFILGTGAYTEGYGWIMNREESEARHKRILRESPGLLFPRVLVKPFDVNTLRAAVFEVLGITPDVSRS